MADDVELWECPDCAFGFDAMHSNADGTYACPVCENARLQAAVDSEIKVGDAWRGHALRLQAVADAALAVRDVHDQAERDGWDETWHEVLNSEVRKMSVALAALDGRPAGDR